MVTLIFNSKLLLIEVKYLLCQINFQIQLDV